jgi:hypothetical protein
MQGNANATFTYRATLKNGTADKQLYALMGYALEDGPLPLKQITMQLLR